MVADSLYVHVPFCRHRCGYCNFSVVADRDDLQSAMVDAIAAELRTIAPTGQPIRTVFLGGGTPTHLRPPLLDQLMAELRQRFLFSATTEVSIEANPEDLDFALCEQLVALGINRLSLGVQSFDRSKLRLLERGHDGTRAADVIGMAAETIGNVSIDLIFGCPGESLSTWETDLDIATRLPIDHVSTYALTFEKGTTFWNRLRRGDLSPAEEETELQMIEVAESRLPRAGLDRYEISNYARAGRECRHNLNYWAGRPWYAVGPGAARFIDGVRSVNHRSPTTYLKRMRNGQSPVAESETLTPQQAARERAAFGVRLIAGIDLARISLECGYNLLTELATALEELVAQDLIERHDDHIRLTTRGRLFADTVAGRFLG